MALKGDLASVDLAQVFQMLALNQKVGILYIQAPRAWKALYFEARGTTVYFNEHVLVDRVLLQMTRTGRLDEESVAEARDHAAHHGLSVVDALLAGGFLDEAELEHTMRLEIEEEIYDLFFWRDATFEFYEGATSVEGREGCVDERFFFSTDSLIMEAARRIDEWSYIQERVPGALEMFRLVDRANVLDVEEFAIPVVDLIDGKRNVARLVEVTGMPSFQVYKALAQLLDQALIEPVPNEDLFATAEDCVDEGRFQDAINLFERALSFGQGVPDAHERVAAVYEQVREYELSAYHHKCVAEYLIKSDDVRKAVTALRHVLEMLPTDLHALERLVEVTVGRRDLGSAGFEPVELGKQLVDLYLEVGEVDRVRGILERMLRDNPEDFELKKSLINVHTRAGDTKRVIELYESIAEDLVRERQPIEAVKYLQKILMIDRSRRDVSERIRSLYELDERRRSRKRSLAALTALFVVLTALGGVWYFYEQHARERHEALQQTVAKALAGRDFGQAIARYEAFIKQFPLTMVGAKAEAELKRIRADQGAYEAELESERRARDGELAKIRSRYKLAWTLCQKQIEERRLDEALASMETVSKLVEQAGQPTDFEWADSVGLDKNQRDTRRYISDALTLDRQAWELLESGDWRAARQRWKRVVDEFSFSATARSVKLPVLLRSRPSGAAVLANGEPVVDREGRAQTTPALLLCSPGAARTYELRLDGFAAANVTLDSSAAPEVDHVLTVLPRREFKYVSPVSTGVTARAGRLAASLRGGRLAMSTFGSDDEDVVIQLGGLDEVAGSPVITPSRVIFRTKELKLRAHALRDGRLLWEESLRYESSADPIVVGARVILTDDQGLMQAFDIENGQRLWRRVLGGAALGQPVAANGRTLCVALGNGRLVMIDAGDGAVLKRLAIGTDLSTGARWQNGAIVVGTTDGRVLVVREDNGRQVWSAQLERALLDRELLLQDQSVLCADGDKKLVLFGLRDGAIEATAQLPGALGLVSGPVASGARFLVGVREVGEDRLERDRLLALSSRDLSVLWEFKDGGRFAASVASDGDSVFLPVSSGAVLQFR